MVTCDMDDLARKAGQTLAIAPAKLGVSGRRIGIYGAGFLGQWAIGFLRGEGIEPVACFDGNPARSGTSFCGVTVLPPEQLAVAGVDLVLITARHAVPFVQAVLARHGIPGCSLDGWYVAAHFDAFTEIHDGFLPDDRSRQTLRAVMDAMLTGKPSSLEEVVERDQYFCLPRFMGSEKESYVDAGAYVGDSIERFIWANAGVFDRIRAFEPSARQYAALETRSARLAAEWALDDGAIELNRAGLASGGGRMSAGTASGQLQSMALEHADGGDIVAVSLDEHLAGERVTFIKADVEGMEMPLLKGAERTIAAFRPKLAICVYHYPADIPVIAAHIRSLVPEYKFALRHHSPQLLETVLYCWVD